MANAPIKHDDTSLHAVNRRRRARYAVVFAGLAAVLFVTLIVNVNTGNVHLSVSQMIAILGGDASDADAYNIVWKIRLPRILAALILGGALSVSGYLLQTYFENPIAGPYVLGISQGARMVVALALIFFIDRVGHVSSGALVAAAFFGSLLATAFIILVSRKIENMAVLLVAGMMIGYLCSAITELAITFASDAQIVNLHNWSQGSFSSMSWSNVQFAGVVTAVALVCTLALSKPIGAFQLGESYARSMGVNVRLFRTVLIVLSSILSATVTAFAGPISFVGIAVPFLVKYALGTSKPLVAIPATFLGGSAFCMVCDLIARMAFAPTELNISTVTAVFGAPVVVFMLLSRKTRRR